MKRNPQPPYARTMKRKPKTKKTMKRKQTNHTHQKTPGEGWRVSPTRRRRRSFGDLLPPKTPYHRRSTRPQKENRRNAPGREARDRDAPPTRSFHAPLSPKTPHHRRSTQPWKENQRNALIASACGHAAPPQRRVVRVDPFSSSISSDLHNGGGGLI